MPAVKRNASPRKKNLTHSNQTSSGKDSRVDAISCSASRLSMTNTTIRNHVASSTGRPRSATAHRVEYSIRTCARDRQSSTLSRIRFGLGAEKERSNAFLHSTREVDPRRLRQTSRQWETNSRNRMDPETVHL